MNHKQKVSRAMEWYTNADPLSRKIAVKSLFDYAIEMGWVGVWDDVDREEMAEEGGGIPEDYETPYFRSCGEPIDHKFS